MGNKRLFKKYYIRLVWEGLIKAFICAFIVGFGASIVPAYIAISKNNFNMDGGVGLWIALGIGVAVAVLSVPLFYLIFFRPNTKKMIKRIDLLDMDQRLITMVELEKDESFMAMLQREDTKAKLKTVKARQLKLSIFVLPVVILTLITFCSAAMVAVTNTEFEERLAWTSAGERELPDPEPLPEPDPDPVEQPDAEVTYYKIIFTVIMGDGYFVGDSFQVVKRGEDTTVVVATPAPGWVFEKWEMEAFENEEDMRNPVRTLYNVQGDMLLWAKFAPPGEGGDEGDPSDNPDVGPTPPPVPPKPVDPYDPNVIVVGEDRYDSEKYWQYYFDLAMQGLADGNMPDDLREMLELYWSYLK